MKTVPYVHSDHYSLLCDVLSKRDHPLPLPREMPKVGYVSLDDDDELVAAAFLRMVEGGYAQIDGLCSNPRYNSAERHKAIKSAVDSLFTKAKELNITSVYAFTVDDSTLLRSKDYGFVKIPHTILAVNL